MTGDLVLALDQGGRSSRAIAFDASGAVVARASREVGEARSGPAETERVEQDAEELVRSLEDAVADVARALGPRVERVVAAGLATQRSSIACFDRASGRALSPAISWQDRRAGERLARVASREDEIVERTGLRLSPHYGATKLAWCLDELADVREARADGRLALGPLASFLAHRLLVERPIVADPANASRTLLWNVERGDWDDELCALFGVPRELLPACVPTRHAFGTIAVGARRVPLEVVSGDQSCALYAWGAPERDALYVNAGTGAFVQRPVEGDAPRVEGLLRSVVLGERARRTCVVEGTINGAASALAHVARELGVERWETELDRWLRTEESPPLFLNGVSGLAAPFWRSAFRSRFVGEGAREAKLVAVAESVAFLARAIVEAMNAVLPPARRVFASGGLARNDALCQRIADVLAMPVERREETEATARGLAWILLEERGARFEHGASRTFVADARSSVRERYARWRAAMERALGE